VTSKERLSQLVAELPDDAVEELLGLVTELAGARDPSTVRELPAFVGIAASGRADVSERVEELLAEGFGR
jgi:hypothetical protein